MLSFGIHFSQSSLLRLYPAWEDRMSDRGAFTTSLSSEKRFLQVWVLSLGLPTHAAKGWDLTGQDSDVVPVRWNWGLHVMDTERQLHVVSPDSLGGYVRVWAKDLRSGTKQLNQAQIFWSFPLGTSCGDAWLVLPCLSLFLEPRQTHLMLKPSSGHRCPLSSRVVMLHLTPIPLSTPISQCQDHYNYTSQDCRYRRLCSGLSTRLFLPSESSLSSEWLEHLSTHRLGRGALDPAAAVFVPLLVLSL